MNLLAAKHNWKQSEALERDARRTLIKAVASAYNDILLATEKERIATADMVYNEKLLKETELKFDAGAVPLSDVLNFRINYNNAENSLISASYSLANSKYTLAALMGLTESMLPPTGKFPPIPSAEETLADVSIYLDTALANRPDLRAYRESLENYKYKYYSSICAFGPVVSATGSTYYQAKTTHTSGSYGNANSNYYQKGWNYGYGAGVSWSVFNGGYTYFGMRQAQASVAQAEFTLAGKWIAVIQEVRSAYDNYNVNVRQARLYKKTLELVKKNRDLVEEQYKAGSAAIELLNQADNNVVSAETNMANSLINMQNAKAQLDAATNAK
jgi:outer membrane protein